MKMQVMLLLHTCLLVTIQIPEKCDNVSDVEKHFVWNCVAKLAISVSKNLDAKIW